MYETQENLTINVTIYIYRSLSNQLNPLVNQMRLTICVAGYWCQIVCIYGDDWLLEEQNNNKTTYQTLVLCANSH